MGFFNRIDGAPRQNSQHFTLVTANNSQRAGCYFDVAGGKTRGFLR
jgi:hypothetical protein